MNESQDKLLEIKIIDDQEPSYYDFDSEDEKLKYPIDLQSTSSSTSKKEISPQKTIASLFQCDNYSETIYEHKSPNIYKAKESNNESNISASYNDGSKDSTNNSDHDLDSEIQNVYYSMSPEDSSLKLNYSGYSSSNSPHCDDNDFSYNSSMDKNFTYFHPISSNKSEDKIHSDNESFNNDLNDCTKVENKTTISDLHQLYFNESKSFAQLSSSRENDLENKKEDSYTTDTSFDWDNYLDYTNQEIAPPTAFLHVEKSLETGIEPGQLVEVIHNEENNLTSYWPAQIISAYGSLLRLKYVVSNEKELWKDIKEGVLFELGHCKAEGIPLKHPSAEVDETPIEDLISKYKSAPKNSLTFNDDQAFTITDDICEGMKVELLNKYNEIYGSIWKVQKNIKGLLILESTCDHHSSEPKIEHIFYSDRLVRPLGWLKKNFGVSSYNCCQLDCCSDGRESHIEELLQNNEVCSLIKSPENLTTHKLNQDTYFEVVHPFKSNTIHPAKVLHIISDTHFKFEIYGCNDLENKTFVTTIDNPNILRTGFAIDSVYPLSIPPEWNSLSANIFTWENFIQNNNANHIESMPYEHLPADELGFLENQVLEVLNPNNEQEMCIGVISQTFEHLLYIKLDSKISNDIFIYPATSCKLFPVGWALNNNYSFIPPSDYSSQLNNSILNYQDDTISNDNKNSDNNSQESLWCSRLYINHWCTCGPFLSKSKVAKKSQFLGPGPVELVLKEVISTTIHSAYIPTKVLREIENIEPNNSTWHPIIMKAKYKRYSLKCRVPIATKASDVIPFLNALSEILQSCKNLWSFSQTGDVCPFNCHPQNSNINALANANAKYNKMGKSGQSNSLGFFWPQKKKKGSSQKRLFEPLKPTNSLLSDEAIDRSDNLFEDNEGQELDEGEQIGSGSEEEENVSMSCEVTPQHSPRTRKRRGSFIDSNLENQKKKRSITNGYLKPAAVSTDPLEWTVNDVEQYINSESAVSHLAVKLKEQEIDGRALLLLNLPTLICHLGLPHSSAVLLAQYICKVKLAHYLNFLPDTC